MVDALFPECVEFAIVISAHVCFRECVAVADVIYSIAANLICGLN